MSFTQAETSLLKSITGECLSRLIGQSKGDAPIPISVAHGDVLIAQGQQGSDVFTLIDGALDVVVDGIKVGHIDHGDIFGVISALADSPRSASIIAAADSLVLKLPREEFLQLMKSRPATVIELIRSMARALVGANDKVVSLSKH
jgi:CRP-like cAMP-binding protein